MDVSRRWVVDSIEEGIAAVYQEGAGLARVPAWMLPPGAREGDVLAVEQSVDAEGASSSLRISIDRAATEEALRRSRERLSRAARGDPGGDIVL